jgi:hypothetical protein
MTNMTALLVWILLAASQIPPPQELAPELRCIEDAQARTVLRDPAVRTLCRGAASSEPVTCFRQALDDALLDNSRAVSLCRCATSAEPVRCFEQARDRTDLDEPEALAICSPIRAQNLSEDCRPIVPTETR